MKRSILHTKTIFLFLFLPLGLLGYSPQELADQILASRNYEECYRLIHQIQDRLPVAVTKKYYTYLEQTSPPVGISEEEFATLRNDIIDKLLQYSRVSSSQSERILAMTAPETYGIIWAGYVLQKLDTLYTLSDTDTQERIVTLLEQTSRHPQVTMSGTAILTLERLATEQGYDPQVVTKLAEQLLENEDLPYQDKISALHVAARLGSDTAIQLARQNLDAETQIAILYRATSLAVLGDHGNANDLALITPYTQNGDYRLRKAATVAQQKISSR